MKLETRDLTRVHEGRAIVDHVNLAVATGEVVMIVGPSGAGKSSLLRLLNRLDEPTAGTAFLDGVDYRRIPPRELRRRVGMIMQTAHLFPGSVADNVRFGPRQRGRDLSEVEIERLLSRVGLSGFGDRMVDRLSGGEAQRVAIARALANDPEVLLLDEPTSALDDSAKAAVEDLLSEIIREESLTCVWVTHDTAQAKRMADRVLVMQNGRLQMTS
ncbi:MAG: ATP-binding cassette domain-containing protein [Chloroflexi bacterium]|nr:ATP-binding cassette domain-containing protein [Chloroflexota bacterium]